MHQGDISSYAKCAILSILNIGITAADMRKETIKTVSVDEIEFQTTEAY
jgi:hypothetical protein